MKIVISVVFILTGLVNLAPLLGVFSASRLHELYAMDFSDPSLQILMRHRAVLFGLLGSYMLIAAFWPAIQLTAAIAGLVSMLSFVFLAVMVGDYNAAIRKVMMIDVMASIPLAGTFIYLLINPPS